MKKDLLQPFGLTFLLLLLFFIANLFFQKFIGFIVPASLLFLPLLVLPPSSSLFSMLFLDPTSQKLGKSFLAFLISVVLIFPPYLILAHFWMLFVFGYKGFHSAPFNFFTKPLFYQLFLVAFPEEFFFRGYLQTAMNKAFQPRWRFLGVHFGWGLVITSLIFAFAHSVIQLKWWHFSIVFPALLFGYLKERTGSITAPILFHAFSNSLMNWFAASYF